MIRSAFRCLPLVLVISACWVAIHAQSPSPVDTRPARRNAVAHDRPASRQPHQGRGRHRRPAAHVLHRRRQRRRLEDDRLPAARGSRSSTTSRPDRSARSPSRRPIRTSSTSAAARDCSGPISPPATASTSRPTPARRGRISACATASRSPQIIVDPRESRSAVRRRARPSRTARTRSAASFARPTAARRSRRCCTRTRTPAASTSRSIRRIPNIVYAVLWEARQGPWENGDFSGPGSGLFKSTDGGTTWRPLTQGLADVGRRWARPHRHHRRAEHARRACSRRSRRDDRRHLSLGRRRRELVPGQQRSARRGAAERRRSARASDQSRHRLRADDRRVEVDRRRQDVHRVARRAGRRRLPADLDQSRQSRLMILTSPTRARSSRVNGGETWSCWYNQPTAQFYHVSTDNAFPYRVCSGQQESGSACVSSRGDDGQITFREWHPGRRRGVRLRRARSARSRHRLRRQGDALRPAHRAGAERHAQAAAHAPTIASCARCRCCSRRSIRASCTSRRTSLWKTTTGGESWDQISPDLTRKDWTVPANVGKYIGSDAGAQPTQRGVIYTIAPSYRRREHASGPAPTTG